MASQVDRLLHAFNEKDVQADAPHTALSELIFSRKTQALAFRGSGNTKHFFWLERGDVAPYAEITAAQTWTDFEVGNSAAGATWDFVTYEIPWRHTEKFHAIACCPTILVLSNAFIAFRIICDDLLDAVALSEGEPMIPAGSPTPNMGMGWNSNWEDDDGGIYSQTPMSGIARINDPTLPANRRVLVKPQVKTVEANVSQIDLGGTVRVYLKELFMFDIPDLKIGF